MPLDEVQLALMRLTVASAWMNIGDDRSDSSSIPAFARRKLTAKRSPSLASSQPFFNFSTGVPATL